MYKKLLGLHHLVLAKDYVAHFADQLLWLTDQIFVNCISSSLFILVCEGNTYNLLVQRNYFQKQSPIASFQKCVLQICMKCTRGDPYGNVISKKLRSTSASVFHCKLAGDLQNIFLEEHFWETGSMFYIICFDASNK